LTPPPQHTHTQAEFDTEKQRKFMLALAIAAGTSVENKFSKVFSIVVGVIYSTQTLNGDFVSHAKALPFGKMYQEHKEILSITVVNILGY